MPSTRARGGGKVVVDVEEARAGNVACAIELAPARGLAELPAAVDELIPHARRAIDRRWALVPIVVGSCSSSRATRKTPSRTSSSSSIPEPARPFDAEDSVPREARLLEFSAQLLGAVELDSRLVVGTNFVVHDREA